VSFLQFVFSFSECKSSQKIVSRNAPDELSRCKIGTLNK